MNETFTKPALGFIIFGLVTAFGGALGDHSSLLVVSSLSLLAGIVSVALMTGGKQGVALGSIGLAGWLAVVAYVFGE